MNRYKAAAGISLFLTAGVFIGSIVFRASTVILRNGDMTLGDEVPDFWQYQRVGKDKLKVVRDTQVFKRGPAALRVSSTSSLAKGQVSQLIDGSSKQPFTLNGFAKSKGKVKVIVAVQSLSKQSKPIQFQQVHHQDNNQDWTSFSQGITLPSDTHQFRIALFLSGEGQAWLDELNLTGRSVKNIPGYHAKLIPPEQQDPLIPMPGSRPDRPNLWLTLHKKYLEQAHQDKNKINVVFLGDSITQGWKNHKGLWQAHYGKKGAVNFGIGGDRTQQILWRLDNGLFDQLQPQLVVLNIGVNNLWGHNFGVARIAAGIEKIVRTIQTKSPRTKILILGILPTGKEPETPLRRQIHAINALSAKLDNGETIHFLDIGSEFVDADGYISKEIMTDYLHLSEKGYQIWANSMQEHFNQILKE